VSKNRRKGNARFYALPKASLDLLLCCRAENLCHQNKTDKYSRRNFARLSVWQGRAWHASGKVRFFRSETDKK